MIRILGWGAGISPIGEFQELRGRTYFSLFAHLRAVHRRNRYFAKCYMAIRKGLAEGLLHIL